MKPNMTGMTATQKTFAWISVGIGILFAGLLIAGGVGAGLSGDITDSQKESLQQDAYEKGQDSVEPETKVETETKEVEVTPEVCKTAIEAGNDGFQIAADHSEIFSKVMGVVQDVLPAAASGDLDTMNEGVEKLEDLNSQLEEKNNELDSVGDDWNEAKTACLDSYEDDE